MLRFLTVASLTLLSALTIPSVAQGQIYRCGNAYSDEACKGSQTVDLKPTVEVHSDSATSSTVFLCRLGQRQFWSPKTCQAHNASTLYRQSVPKNWAWEQQWQHAQREWHSAEHRTATQAPLTHHADTSQLAQRQRARPDCAQSEQRIRQLDDMGRQGGTASFMERLRRERKELRDWQFRVGC